jgi:hypothetical protein
MKIIGLDGHIYHIDIRSSRYKLRSRERSKSHLQFSCGQILREKFPLSPLLEEVYLTQQKLYFDFLLPTLKLVFEINGRQHDTYIPFFHKNKKNFFSSKQRDSNKQILCEINNFALYNITDEEELKRILNNYDG